MTIWPMHMFCHSLRFPLPPKIITYLLQNKKLEYASMFPYSMSTSSAVVALLKHAWNARSLCSLHFIVSESGLTSCFLMWRLSASRRQNPVAYQKGCKQPLRKPVSGQPVHSQFGFASLLMYRLSANRRLRPNQNENMQACSRPSLSSVRWLVKFSARYGNRTCPPQKWWLKTTLS